ncbi:MAG: flagellar hook-associated protein FlgK, partial [Aliifodinibius sp.]|nr:flagellar hook-associated protein FlgK [candidate division Zixibacteria bacterium]NIT55025.1 flagellar hook-associated protein FlgK [Fodinibius sp.]NIW43426.1 flagellar hook-associated protein FlgK [Gammaproteobacteria bacterium]NIS44584.1 flagellar hook-associated protein FlgK [candidate division Zixibacteria bacterium]NIU12642.1 flagellar hook-associated protein FlgK [candidate division Zixibacteria bacterium]
QNYRESIVGVSSDEELADIEKFQNAYAAAARLVGVADEMFQSLINMLG